MGNICTHRSPLRCLALAELPSPQHKPSALVFACKCQVAGGEVSERKEDNSAGESKGNQQSFVLDVCFFKPCCL